MKGKHIALIIAAAASVIVAIVLILCLGGKGEGDTNKPVDSSTQSSSDDGNWTPLYDTTK